VGDAAEIGMSHADILPFDVELPEVHRAVFLEIDNEAAFTSMPLRRFSTSVKSPNHSSTNDRERGVGPVLSDFMTLSTASIGRRPKILPVPGLCLVPGKSAFPGTRPATAAGLGTQMVF
jgi:hypothetical protein